MGEYVLYVCFGLLAIGFLYLLARKKAQWKSKGEMTNGSKKNAKAGNGKSERYGIGVNCADICIDILVVFVGAILAVVITNYSTNQHEEKNLVLNLKAAHDDILSQTVILEDVVQRYDSTGNVSELVMNTNIDTELLEKVLYTDSALEYLPKPAYSLVLSACRSLGLYQMLLTSLDSDAIEAVEVVKGIQRCADYIVYEIELVLKFMNGEVSETLFLDNLTKHMDQIKAENENLMWNN